jgi:hypothetical protein
MHWSRLACRFAVLTVFVLHATCLDTRNWSSEQVRVIIKNYRASFGRCDLFVSAMASSRQHTTHDPAANA